MKALDLFCGAGGAADGLIAAGFEVVGIDIRPQPRYPGCFIQADALMPPVNLDEFQFVWASPPCQAFSRAGHLSRRHINPNLIPAVRYLLRHHPFTVIENVPHAPMMPTLKLTGPSVGLNRIRRERWFECSFFVLAPPLASPPSEKFRSGEALTILKRLSYIGNIFRERAKAGRPTNISKQDAADALGLKRDGAEFLKREIGEMVPPAYSEYIGRQALLQMG